MGSILHGIEVPPDGGDTLFANMYAVYEALSDDMKERVRRLRVLHSHDQVLSHDQKLKSASEDYTKLPPVHHPLVRRHPVTGGLSLFLSPRRRPAAGPFYATSPGYGIYGGRMTLVDFFARSLTSVRIDGVNVDVSYLA